MRTITILMILSFLTICMMGGAQTHVTTFGSIEVQQSLLIQKLSDLSFGRVLTPQSESTVTISPDGTRTTTGAILTRSSYSAATYQVWGQSGNTYQIIMPTECALECQGAGLIMVDQFTITGGSTLRTIVSGSDQFGIGATVHLESSQGAGVYTGSYEVTVSYN